MVIHHDDVKGKVGFLRERILHRVRNCSLSVLNRYDDRSLNRERAGCLLLCLSQAPGRDVSPNLLQIGGKDSLHLLLDFPVTGVYISEQLLTRRRFIPPEHRVEGLPFMMESFINGKLQTQIVDAGKFHLRYGPVFLQRPPGGRG
ncbi:MAG: hypothetical protein A4E57_04030 [Syntrophorhabdaceae bacterium PtaU1.Bin034]|nr:MAG: hypothetical protein A4E57_04030 [Syntrophorhabdaceae bacterium PtaU1.Bin034]